MYKLLSDTSAVCTDTGISFPLANGNREYIKYTEWLAEGNTPESVSQPEKAAAQIESEITGAVQSRLDEWARTRNYDGVLSACTYATSGVTKFAAEGQAAVNARDATWSAMYALLAEVQGGTRPMPTGYADVEPLLPSLGWPA